MTTPAAPHRSGWIHELFLHSTTVEMVKFVIRFAQDGVDAEEPTLLELRPDTAAIVQEAVAPSPHLTVLPAMGQPARPASDLRAADALLTRYRPYVRRVRILNQEPTVPKEHWHEWRRLEAVVNVALAHHNAWAVCVYDQRVLAAEQVEDLCATHPVIRQGDQDLRNDRYQDPVEFASARRDAPPDPVEQTAPAVELTDPSPVTARAAVIGFARRTELASAEVEGLVLATSEAVTNAIVHGQSPIVLRLWAQPDRVTVTVTDTGRGPTDPFVGLLAPDTADGRGLGLWICHQLVDVTHRRRPGGYTVRMTATRPRTAGGRGASDHPGPQAL
ncbi:anti-sigma factor RsbA family regulatory protein [Pseudonocardia charpentierae]|uniref:Anti-sigma factor RsbA family regulatory protein n=1 Tax=Pseudonocardia charpentierae TaxID=3075545 RepID=A0ABU2NJ65_9PSEU|nr:anti-sigma factor RsbA family regulatory protein [Pseudonocardia sp. DSM 45834]MDT0354021.1 anti-sigma factor RsbA family regulatory protein [Pseudonocardia sp. DSM 45834]